MLTPTGRMIKRLIILVVYALVFSAAGGGIYLLASPNETCFDSVKNQNEEGIDCGGVCEKKCVIPFQPLLPVIRSVTVIPSPDRTTLVARVHNPNLLHGARSIDYTWRVFNASRQLIESVGGSTYLLPGRERYLVEHIAQIPHATTAEIMFTSAEANWQKLKEGYRLPELDIVEGNRVEFTPDDPARSAYVRGDVINNSALDLGRILVNVLLFDTDDRVVAARTTEMDTVRSGERRFFNVEWREQIRTPVKRVLTEPLTNILDNENFITKKFWYLHFGSEWQEI
ncbi:MAG: hypothetical protein HY460_02350, partial [Parcubacteria group bacterium]|nr:hypothetical protein [Parcubacteria group bacterium]